MMIFLLRLQSMYKNLCFYGIRQRINMVDVSNLIVDLGMVLGRGAKSCVFKGRLGIRRVVAVKRLDKEDKDSAKAFYRELMIAGSLNHHRIVPLVGFCVAKEGLFLVYRFVAGGSLESHLHGM